MKLSAVIVPLVCALGAQAQITSIFGYVQATPPRTPTHRQSVVMLHRRLEVLSARRFPSEINIVDAS